VNREDEIVNRIIFSVVLLLGLGLSNVYRGQENSQKVSENEQKSTRYSRFLNRNGSFILSKTYYVGHHTEGHSFDVSALIAWELGSSEKIYAAVFAGLVIDYDDLEELQRELDKIIRTVGKELDTQATTSMRYKALNGLEFFTFDSSSSNPQRMVRLVFRGTMLTTGSMNSVVELRALVAQVRERLISLGAK